MNLSATSLVVIVCNGKFGNCNTFFILDSYPTISFSHSFEISLFLQHCQSNDLSHIFFNQLPIHVNSFDSSLLVLRSL